MWASHILTLLSRLTMPVVTTLHTVLSTPTPAQRSVLDRIIAASSRVIVMAEKGAELLRLPIACRPRRLRSFRTARPMSRSGNPTRQKRLWASPVESVILTFGLLSPSKGIEVMIDAMPSILDASPMPSTSCSERPIPIWFASRARPIAEAWRRAPAHSESASKSYFSIDLSIRRH